MLRRISGHKREGSKRTAKNLILWPENLKGRDHLGDPGTGEKKMGVNWVQLNQ
jgi:hypothetical protein